jgi:HEPN domain-containing protein
MKRLTRQWLRKAEDDQRLAARALNGRPPLYDGACYHSQQAVEKYLKSLLNELGLPVPKVHNLEYLLELLLPHDAALRSLRRTIQGLTRYAVEYRYPGWRAIRRQAVAARRKAERVRTEIHLRLGLRPRP